MHNASSGFCNVTRGILQGSTLSGLLFLMFINDIVNCSFELFFNLFADDTCVYLRDRNIPDLYRTMNLELVKLGVWLSANKLALNIEKTVYLLFRGKKRIANFQNLYIHQKVRR